MARTIPTCSAALLLFAAAPAFADTGVKAYMQARAAEADGRGIDALAAYARALDASPRDPIVAIRAYREAIAGGDARLARRAAAVLTTIGVAPIDAALLPLADAARAGDAEAAARALPALQADRLGLLVPVLRGWIAHARGGDGVAALDAEKPDLAARPLIAEHRALLLIAAGREEGVAAIEALGAAARRSPARLAAAELLAGAGKGDRAVALLGRNAEPVEPARATLGFGVSRLLLRLSEELSDDRASDFGLALARAALDADAAFHRARIALARQFAGQEEPDRALAALAAIPAESLLGMQAAAARVEVLARAERDDAALAAARAAAEAKDAHTLDRARYADLLVAAGRSADAVPIYARILEDDRLAEAWPAWLRYGGALEAAGRWKDARRALRRAVELGPDEPGPLNSLGYLKVDRGEDVGEATRMLERAHLLDPDDPAIADSLGWAYHRGGDSVRALPLLEEAASEAPTDTEINEHLGDAYWSVGRRFEARYAWRAAALAAAPEAAARLAAKQDRGL